LAIDEEQGLVYVADYMRHTILVYKLADGEYLFEVGGRGTEPGYFNFPNHMTINKHRQIIVADLFNNRVQVLEMGYEDWKNRYELESSTESPSVETENGSLESPDQDSFEPDTSEGTNDRVNQQESSPKETKDEFEVIIQQKSPSISEATGKDPSNGQELNQEKFKENSEPIIQQEGLTVPSGAKGAPETVPKVKQEESDNVFEVIFSEEDPPSFSEPKTNK
jgi:hypothetical protein